MWRAGSWHCARCRYDNFRENVGCRKCGGTREAEGRERQRGETSERWREWSGRQMKDRDSERSTGRKYSRSCDRKKRSNDHDVERLGRRKSRIGHSMKEKVTDKNIVSSSGFDKKRELESSSPLFSSKNLSIISPAGCIKRLENLPEGKTPLWVKTFPDIVEYLGKFGTISDVRDETDGISKITFFKKSSAVKALSSSHKHYITFYEKSTLVAGHHDVEDRLGEGEDSRVKALKNYEDDVNSFLFGSENVHEMSTAEHSGNKIMKNKDSKNVNNDSQADRKASDSLYSRRTAAKKPRFHIPHGKVFGVEADMSFVKEAENNKWKIAVERFESMRDDAHTKFNKKLDDDNDDKYEHDVGGVSMKIKTIVKAARVPNVLERRLLAMAGGYEDPGSVSGKVVLRSRNSDENTELVDIADSDEEVMEVKEEENDCQSKLVRLERASEEEKGVILKSMGIVSRVSEPLLVDDMELVDLSDNVGKDTEPIVKKARELLVSNGDSVRIGIAPPLLDAKALVDLSVSQDTDPSVGEDKELIESSARVGDTDTPVIEVRECVDLSDSDTGLYSDGSEGLS